MAAWVDLAEVRTAWREGANVSDAELQELVDAAQEVCQEFAPALADGTEPPARYRRAVILQVRELYAAARRDGDVIQSSSEQAYQLRARPLTATVMQLLRPRRGLPRVG